MERDLEGMDLIRKGGGEYRTKRDQLDERRRRITTKWQEAWIPEWLLSYGNTRSIQTEIYKVAELVDFGTAILLVNEVALARVYKNRTQPTRGHGKTMVVIAGDWSTVHQKIIAGSYSPAVLDNAALATCNARLGRYYVIEADDGPRPQRCQEAWNAAIGASVKHDRSLQAKVDKFMAAVGYGFGPLRDAASQSHVALTPPQSAATLDESLRQATSTPRSSPSEDNSANTAMNIVMSHARFAGGSVSRTATVPALSSAPPPALSSAPLPALSSAPLPALSSAPPLALSSAPPPALLDSSTPPLALSDSSAPPPALLDSSAPLPALPDSSAPPPALPEDSLTPIQRIGQTQVSTDREEDQDFPAHDSRPKKDGKDESKLLQLDQSPSNDSPSSEGDTSKEDAPDRKKSQPEQQNTAEPNSEEDEDGQPELTVNAFAPRMGRVPIAVNPGAIFARFPDVVPEEFEEAGTITADLFSWLAPIRKLIISEFECYRWHYDNGSFPSETSLNHLMVHSLTQQIIRQDPMLYSLHVALRPDHCPELISYPCGVKYSYHGSTQIMPEITLDATRIKDMLETGKGSSIVHGSVAIDSEMSNHSRIGVGLHQEMKDWYKLASARALECEESNDATTTILDYTGKDAEKLDLPGYVASPCKRGEARISMPFLPQRQQSGTVYNDRRVVYPWLVAILENDQLEDPRLGSLQATAEAHRTLRNLPFSPISNSSAVFKQYRFPPAVGLRGFGPLHDALIGQEDWDSPAVRAEAAFYLDGSASAEDVMEKNELFRSHGRKLFKEKFDIFEKEERRVFQEKSFFKHMDSRVVPNFNLRPQPDQI